MILAGQSQSTDILAQLDKEGLAVLPNFVQGEVLTGMQRAFNSRLKRQRWNNFEGYERTERFRLMVENVLLLDQGFVSTALDPAVKEILRSYLGDRFRLVEAKGWRSLPTRRKFHAWHGDAWYDQKTVSGIPREVKLGLYLTDVSSGAFRYIRGTHRQHQPRDWRNHEIDAFPAADISVVTGKAGTAFLFDTSGIHGQSWPILEPRHAVFFNYHDSAIPLQEEDLAADRYHPLLLNAAFLGGLSSEDYFILGFGDKTNFIPAFERPSKHESFQRSQTGRFTRKLFMEDFTSRVKARLGVMFGGK
jgi:hypothetical protein